MTGVRDTDWDPGAYHRFRGLRLRPALDLLRSLPALPEGPIVDLGCGSGSVGPALATLGRPIIGVDGSPAMLAEAEKTGVYTRLIQTDIDAWTPDGAPALIFSNAALHWIPGHDTLMPRLAGALVRGGVLAVQMPHQNNAPSHRLWPSLVQEFWGDGYDGVLPPGAHNPAYYHRLLAPLGKMSLWETEYYQNLDARDDGHPVRRFTEATYARPLLNALEPDMRTRLISLYEAAIDKTYPKAADGSVLFPFKRLFFTLSVPG